ncbi:MAG: hypothetical protein HY287_01900 [Planctomycetes bacterium]|nr:hypothetical protein [Planctomycetota bacterium]MBI3833063.1 hypothetical protein [Planctomycetota bacterium]
MKSIWITTAFVNVSLLAHALAVPPTPLPDPSGINKNRYISMSIPDTGGNPVAIRVTLTSLMHPNPPNLPANPPPDFTAYEGEYRWVGPPQTYTNSDTVSASTFEAAQLQCAPYYADFAPFGLIHVYGDSVVPSSLYDAVVFDTSCNGNEATCTEISSPLQLKTMRWGDVMPPFQAEGGALSQPNLTDYSAQIDTIDRTPSSRPKVEMQIAPNVPNPAKTVNALDATAEVDAFKSYAYPLSGPTPCGAEARSDTSGATKLNSVQGSGDLRGGGSVKVYVTPVAAQGTLTYPGGTTIVGQELHAKSGGFQAFFEFQISGWDSAQTGSIDLRTYEVQADSSGFLSVNANPAGVGGDLALAQIACQKMCNGGVNAGQLCTTNGQCPGAQCADPCPTTLGLSDLRCGSQVAGFCPQAFITRTHPDYFFSYLATSDSVPYSTPLSPFGPISAAETWSGMAHGPADSGQRLYLGTFVLDIPANALGRYTISIRPEETLVAHGANGFPTTMSIESVPAVVEIGTIADAKNRYLTIGAPDRGEAYAIRVKLTSLMHPDPPNLAQYPAPDFSAYEGQYRWVGSVGSHQETDVPPSNFLSSSLQCAPFYSDFHADTSGGVLQLTGRDVVPSSIYDIDIVPLSCQGNEGACADIVPYLTLKTARHGDVASPNQQPSPASLSQPDISDIAAIVDKFKSVSTAEITAFTDLAPLAPVGTVNIGDVGVCVDAFKSLPYVQGTPTDCP